MNVAFCINRLALAGLGVTVSSLIRNCSNPDRLILWFLSTDLTQLDKLNLGSLLRREGFNGQFNIIECNPLIEFGNFKSLDDDWTTYGRLLIPELLNKEEVALYLDADLVVELDVLEVSEYNFKGQAIAAVLGSQIKHSIDEGFLTEHCNLTPEDHYFNAGVLLLNLSVWRSQNLKAKCIEIGNRQPDRLLSSDQSILNGLFSRSFAKLPDKYNKAWYANKDRPQGKDKMILHFVGSPKPWDIWGEFLHNGYQIWSKYLDDVWNKNYGQPSLSDYNRAWKIRSSYLRLLKKKLVR